MAHFQGAGIKAMAARVFISYSHKDEELRDRLEVQLSMLIVSRYVEIFVARRMWNYKSTDYNTVQYNAFLTMKAIRRLSAGEIAEKLIELLAQDGVSFGNRPDFALTGSNRKYIQRMLARMTEYTDAALLDG